MFGFQSILVLGGAGRNRLYYFGQFSGAQLINVASSHTIENMQGAVEHTRP